MSSSIGIGITTRNRPAIFARSLQEIRKYAPRNSKLVIVDDASDVPVVDADFRFEANAGVAAAKNKCLELLEDCEHIFLFDDDCYPLMFNWHKAYVDCPEPHLMYQFRLPGKGPNDMRVIHNGENFIAYSHTRGSMLYFHRSVLGVVGGFNTDYVSMGEHTDLTNRIHNAGLTSYRAMDVPNSSEFLYCLDQDGKAESSIPGRVRRMNVRNNRRLLINSRKTNEYRSYK